MPSSIQLSDGLSLLAIRTPASERDSKPCAGPSERRTAARAKLAFKLAVTAGVLVLLLSSIPLAAILEALSGAAPSLILAGMALQGAMRLAAAGRLKLLADVQSLGLSTGRLLAITLAANFYVLLLPGSAAGGLATWIKYVRHGAAKGAALLVIGINRGLALAVLIAFGLVAVVVDGLVGGLVAAAILGLALGVVALACWAVFVRPDRSAQLLLGVARLPGLRRLGMEARLAGLATRLTQFGTLSPRGVALVVLLSIVHEILGTGVMWAFAQALGLELGFAAIAWIRVAVQLVLILPLSIAGLGLRELTLVGLTTGYGIAPAAAVAWSLVIFAGTVAAALLGGALEAHALWRRRDAETAP